MSMLDWFLKIPGLDPGDDIPPTIALSSPFSGTVYDTVLVTATASEDITGLAAGDITLINCLLSEWTAVSAKVYTFVLTAIAGGTFSAQIPAGSYTDLSSNLGAASDALSFTYGIEWFVSLTGSDAADGLSKDTPKLTIGAALAAAGADLTRKTIGVMGNNAIYRHTAYLNVPDNVKIRGYNSDVPVLSRATLLSSWVKTGGYTNVYESAIGATVTVVEAVYQDTVTSLTSRADLATLDAAAEGFYADFAADKLYINMSGVDKDPAGNTIEAVSRIDGTTAQTEFVYLGNSSQLVGCTVRHAARVAVNSNATVTPAVVSNCVIEYHMGTLFSSVGLKSNGSTRLLTSSNNVFRKCKTGLSPANGSTVTSTGDRFTEFAVGTTTILAGTTEVFTLNNVTLDNNLMTATDTLLIQAHWTLTGFLVSHHNAGIGVRVNCPVGGHSVSGWSVYNNGNMGIIHNSGGPLTIADSDIYANGSNGVNGNIAGALIVNDSRIYNNGGPGLVSSGTGSKALYCLVYNNVSANINLTGGSALIEGCKNYTNATATPTWNFTVSGASGKIRMCIAHGLSVVSSRSLTGDNIRVEYNCFIQRVGGSYTLELEEITHAWAYANMLINEQGYYSLIMKKINALAAPDDHGGAEKNIAVFGQIYCKASVGIYFRGNYIYHRVSPSFFVARNGIFSSAIEFTGNTIDGGDTAVTVDTGNEAGFVADNNHYINNPTKWNWVGTDYNTLAAWKAASSVDAASDETAPTVNEVLVAEAENADLAGIKWGWIVISNWSGGATVTVDLSSLTTLVEGNTYKLQNALNAAESLNFVYNGSNVVVTMANWSTDAIYEAYPRFGAFTVESV